MSWIWMATKTYKNWDYFTNIHEFSLNFGSARKWGGWIYLGEWWKTTGFGFVRYSSDKPISCRPESNPGAFQGCNLYSVHGVFLGASDSQSSVDFYGSSLTEEDTKVVCQVFCMLIPRFVCLTYFNHHSLLNHVTSTNRTHWQAVDSPIFSHIDLFSYTPLQPCHEAQGREQSWGIQFHQARGLPAKWTVRNRLRLGVW